MTLSSMCLLKQSRVNLHRAAYRRERTLVWPREQTHPRRSVVVTLQLHSWTIAIHSGILIIPHLGASFVLSGLWLLPDRPAR